MSPTPVTFNSPTAPASYSLGSDRRGGRRPLRPRPRDDRPLRPQHVAGPAGRSSTGLLAAGRFVAPLSEYPPTDYRRLVEAAAARYGVTPAELLVGAGADEILDIVAKVVHPGRRQRRSSPSPTYAMYRVLTEQRGATVVAVPRLGEAAGWALDRDAVRAAAAEHDAAVVWLCSPNNPTALPEPEGAIAALLAGPRRGRGRGRATGTRSSSSTRRTPSSSGPRSLGLRDDYPNLIVVRTASKAYALAGLRVGFAIARPEVIARLNPFRPPGSISTVSVTLVTEALRDDSILDDNLARVETERTRLTEALRGVGWSVGPSVTNFILVDFGSAERAAAVAEGLLARGLVPRTFGAAHPLADHLRLTIRAADENDRLIAAATELAEETRT